MNAGLHWTVESADDAKVIEMINLSMRMESVCCAFWVIGERNSNRNIIILGQIYRARDN